MTLAKDEKSNVHKQRKLSNDERPVKGSNERERIFYRYQRMPKYDIRSSYVGLCGPRVTRPLSLLGMTMLLTEFGGTVITGAMAVVGDVFIDLPRCLGVRLTYD